MVVLFQALNILDLRDFYISAEQQLCLDFGETELQFNQVVQAMTKAGCPLRLMSALVIY